jgi:hypothetical protein
VVGLGFGVRYCTCPAGGGLDSRGLLIDLDCGSRDQIGTLIMVPPSLFELVARRVAQAHTSSIEDPTGQIDWWWKGFLAYRCSADFLRLYLSIENGVIDCCLRIGEYVGNEMELQVLATLHEAKLLPEDKCLEALRTVSQLAIVIPDADWLGLKEATTLFTNQERAEILDRVRQELIPNLGNMLTSWRLNEIGDSAEDYYQPILTIITKVRPQARAGILRAPTSGTRQCQLVNAMVEVSLMT